MKPAPEIPASAGCSRTASTAPSGALPDHGPKLRLANCDITAMLAGHFVEL